MPRAVSGMRIARSLVTPTGAASVSRELDFQLGSEDGIEIFGVLGHVMVHQVLVGATFSPYTAVQTIHLETGALEDILEADAEDNDTIDSDIFYRQDMNLITFDGTTESAAAMMVMPTGLITYPVPILSARNITHQGSSQDITQAFGLHVMIFYRFVQFSLQELGLLLARRG